MIAIVIMLTVKRPPIASSTAPAPLLGATHLLFAGRDGPPPEPEAVRKVVTTVIAGVER
jgi:hypothetical protein